MKKWNFIGFDYKAFGDHLVMYFILRKKIWLHISCQRVVDIVMRILNFRRGDFRGLDS